MSGLQQRVDSNTPLVRASRALHYAGFAVWSVIFFLFPPMAFHNTTDLIFRAGWLGLELFAALFAIVGVVSRIDFRLELPMISIMLLGPAIYLFGQVLVVLNPASIAVPGMPIPDPSQRYALIAFALLPILGLLPRITMLRQEASRVRRLNSTRAASVAIALHEEQAAQRREEPR